MRLELATIFAKIQRAHVGMEATAAQILEVVKLNDAKSLDKFNELVDVAYDRNGWSRRVGRPKAGDIKAPSAVQVYVSTLRRAYRMGLKVIKFNNMEEIRRELRKPRGQQAPVADELIGVSFTGTALTGHLYHDVLRIRQALPEDEQHDLDAQVRRVLNKYVKKAPPELRLVA